LIFFASFGKGLAFNHIIRLHHSPSDDGGFSGANEEGSDEEDGEASSIPCTGLFGSLRSTEIVREAGKRNSLLPTQLPMDALQALLLACTEPGDLILDLFSGSGTVSASALASNRCCVGIDVDARCVKAATLRLTKIGNKLLAEDSEDEEDDDARAE
jgi:DNA modification methylase